MKKLLLTLGFCLLAGSALAANLRIGSSADYPPWESVDDKGQIVGFERDMGDVLCQKIAATCTWTNQNFDGLLPALKVGKFDVAISAISITDERAKEVDFTRAYADVPNNFVVREGTPAASAKSADDLLKDLATASIGVENGTTHEQVIRAHFPKATLKVYARPDQVADDLAAGRLDAGLMERSTWDALIKTHANDKLVYAGPQLMGKDFAEFGKGLGIAIRKGSPDLVTKLDNGLAEMLKDGTIKAESIKWFGYDISMH